MRIVAVEAWAETFELARPYAIAFRAVSAVDNLIVRIVGEHGHEGLGAAAPEPHVTGETPEACRAALLGGALDWLIGADVRTLPALARELERRLPAQPAARAAVDMALHDLLARALGLPLVDLLGRAHESLPTSVTIGIKASLDEVLAEADEYIGRGFTALKVKVGRAAEDEIERLVRLRERVGHGVTIRVDANQGYTMSELGAFLTATAHLDIELLEQPLPPGESDALRGLPEATRARLAADESLHGVQDALELAARPRPYGIFNIKLMKCGGLSPALRIAALAEAAGIELMWGCMDESVVSIAAALHAALASPATRYLDLDGSLDLARDVAEGGFVLEAGRLRTVAAPGLGVRLRARG